MVQDEDIICETRGAAGLATLNRPKALNAITHEMVRVLGAALDAWERDPAVTRVVLKAAPGRAFSAGGDIRHLYDLHQAGKDQEALAFWRDEYVLNTRIKRYPKPYVALIDGMVMGGGVGVSLHGSHRVAGERYLFAMPEVGIGFFPDVGATYALPRLPDRMGFYLALTGSRVGPAEALELGLVTHAVSSDALAGLETALIEGEPVDDALAAAARPAAPSGSALLAERSSIAEWFAGDTVLEILANLDDAAPGSVFAAEIAATIRGKSPTALAVALEQMRRGGALDFEDAMRTEFRIVSRVVAGHDFYEGVRAAIIDKDGKPRWRPGDLAALSPAEIERYFAPLGERELDI